MKKLVALFTVMFALSFNVTAKTVTICGGAEGGEYERKAYKIGQQIKRKYSKLKVQVRKTNGSLENIELFDDKECDIALVQEDALNVSAPNRSFKGKIAHTEVVYWFYNLKHKKTDLEDIESQSEYRLVIVEDSGSDVTFRNFVNEDSGYSEVYKNAIFVESFYDAADIVSEGFYTTDNGKRVKVAGTIYVTRPAMFDKEVVKDFKGKIGVGELTDKDFNDSKNFSGDLLYKTCKIDRTHTKGLDRATWGSQDTVCMSAQVIYAKDLGIKKMNRIINKALK